jgi:hypothetical protein
MEGKFSHQILPFALTADDCFMGEFTSFNFVRIGLHSIRGCLENFLVWKGDWSYSIFPKSHGTLPECAQNHSSIIKQQQNSAKPSNPITNFVHKKSFSKEYFLPPDIQIGSLFLLAEKESSRRTSGGKFEIIF